MDTDTEQAPLQLTPLEARIIGALIEKEITTPEYYPLTLNALAAACSQKNNRSPVMDLDGQTLQNGIYSLQEKRLVECFSGATARTVKYRERFIAALELDREERALLCELLLRGPQTAGELKNRAARMHPFATLEETLAALARLAARDPQPFVAELPRLPGHKENRFAHLLGDQPPALDAPPAEPAWLATGDAATRPAGRVDALETRVAALEEEVAAMKALFATFKSQFE
ncbi:MAG: YceH family protein [Verrucomicrobiota bacterium]|jgi:uncharacterized protein YceH (UPF0502 family)|nr:YceH family protein [Verrucomicrobiota bacterium]